MTTDLQRSRHVSLEFIVKLYVHLTLAIFLGGGQSTEYTVFPILPFLQYWVRSIVDLPDL